MHGRLKIKTTAEQQEEKRKEREKKLVIYRAAIAETFTKRENKEFDDSAIKINHQLLLSNPDITTLWNFQREILLHKKKLEEGDLNELFNNELYFIESCLRVNPKSYGAWHHRCWVLDNMPNPNWSRELMLCDRLFESDDRNFHCWDYRRFVVKRANISPEDELKFTMKLINNNFSNYSAWHYRSKLLPLVYPDTENPINIKEEIRLQELELVQNAAFTDPNDQSAWFYHRWLLGKDKPLLQEEPLKLLCFYVNRERKLVLVTLKEAVNLNSSLYNLKVTVNEEIVDGIWHPTREDIIVSSIWLFWLPADLDKIEDSVKIGISASGFYEETEQMTLDLTNNQVENWLFNIPSFSNYFGMKLSEAETTLLENELESCEQLMELEPDDKWASLTSVFLMRAIDPNKYENHILTQIKSLDTSGIDINRKNYYQDMKSKFVIENVLKQMPLSLQQTDNSIREVQIVGENLTAIYNFDHLVLVTKLDLSNNHLHSLKQFHSLQCLRELKIANNLIDSCSGLEHLPLLELLNCDDNKIETTNALEPLISCPKLKSLSILNNPIENGSHESILSWINGNFQNEIIIKFL